MNNELQPSPKLQSPVSLHEELGGVFNSQSAVAIWYADDRIGVYAYDAPNRKYTAKYFECSVRDIEWVMASMALLTIRLHNRNYAIDFDPAAFQALMASSAVGAASSSVVLDTASLAGGLYADHMSKGSGVDEWLAAFKDAGVNTDAVLRNPGILGLKWGLIASVGLIVFFILSFIVYLMFQ